MTIPILKKVYLENEGSSKNKSFHVVLKSQSYFNKGKPYNKEPIQHLFFECPFAKIIWRITYMTSGLAPPKNIAYLFGNWLKGIPKKRPSSD
jgi:anaerobic glycerol-3-phosphate dehydrogenase